jgi:hypothetical protein
MGSKVMALTTALGPPVRAICSWAEASRAAVTLTRAREGCKGRRREPIQRPYWTQGEELGGRSRPQPRRAGAGLLSNVPMGRGFENWI